MNNITVDGSVLQQLVRPRAAARASAPASRRSRSTAIEQVQVSVAPFDVRQGNFVGAGVNTVTRSGTNTVPRLDLPPVARQQPRRHQGRRTPTSIPARSTSATPAAGSAGPIVKNKAFFFGNYENETFDAAAARRSAPTTAVSRSAAA